MNLLKKILKNEPANLNSNTMKQVAVNVCVNCWGKQEYDDQYLAVEKDQKNGRRKAFVMQFVETYITGVALKP